MFPFPSYDVHSNGDPILSMLLHGTPHSLASPLSFSLEDSSSSWPSPPSDKRHAETPPEEVVHCLIQGRKRRRPFSGHGQVYDPGYGHASSYDSSSSWREYGRDVREILWNMAREVDDILFDALKGDRRGGGHMSDGDGDGGIRRNSGRNDIRRTQRLRIHMIQRAILTTLRREDPPKGLLEGVLGGGGSGASFSRQWHRVLGWEERLRCFLGMWHLCLVDDVAEGNEAVDGQGKMCGLTFRPGGEDFEEYKRVETGRDKDCEFNTRECSPDDPNYAFLMERILMRLEELQTPP
ncbi:hypothetical protein ACHAXS_001647, partial [Conticribra weissflogii]